MADSRSRSSPDPAATIEPALVRWLAAGDSLCLALSGGRDSVALLHLLVELAPRFPLVLSAIHVHHGLSPHADDWAAFCEAACARLGVPLRVVRVKVAVRPGEGLEAAARRARYEAFLSVDAAALALAHHAGDQAETVLFRLARGSAVLGAAAVPETRMLTRADGTQLRLLRPLLEVAPKAIAEFVAQRGLAHVTDESNADRRHRRNFLRHDVLPALDARIPGASRQLAAAARHFREAARMLDELAEIDARRCAGARGLVLAGLRELPEPRQRNLLAWRLRQAGVPVPERGRLCEIRRQLVDGPSERELRFGIGGGVLHAWRGELEVLREMTPADGGAKVWRGEASLRWGGGELRFERGLGEGIAAGRLLAAPVTIGARGGGERLRPDPARPRRSLKNLFQEAAWPPSRRERVPLLWCGDRLVWVPGIGIDADFQAAEGEEGWRVAWVEDAAV